MKYLLALVILLVSCSKKDNPSPDNSFRIQFYMNPDGYSAYPFKLTCQVQDTARKFYFYFSKASDTTFLTNGSINFHIQALGTDKFSGTGRDTVFVNLWYHGKSYHLFSKYPVPWVHVNAKLDTTINFQ